MWIMNHNFDVIIIGAGLSGIALAIELISRTDKSLLIVEKKVKLKKDKNWCFWNEPKNHFSDLFDNKWDEIVVKAKGEQLIKKASNRSYLRISSKKFYDEGLRIINKSKKARLILGQHIDSINELKREVKSLRQDVSKGKGAVAVLVFIGTLVASIVGFLNFK